MKNANPLPSRARLRVRQARVARPADDDICAAQLAHERGAGASRGILARDHDVHVQHGAQLGDEHGTEAGFGDGVKTSDRADRG